MAKSRTVACLRIASVLSCFLCCFLCCFLWGCGETLGSSPSDAGGGDGDSSAGGADSGPSSIASPGDDGCKPSPCEHGDCEPDEDAYVCTCDAGYEGPNCGVDTDDCDPNPCEHGSCTDAVDGYVCACADGYEGADCDVDIDDCDPNPCVHGSCTDAVDGYTCGCDAGYEGTNCDVDIDDCDPDPCGMGTCVDGVASYVCQCRDGWFGDDCDVSCDDGDVATNDWYDEVLGCGHRIADWTVFDSGLQADHGTGLGWWIVPGPITYANFMTQCDGLEVGGRDDWRLPTIDETRTWGAGCADTITGGSCPIADPACLDESCGFGVAGECSSCQGGQGPHPAGGYCRPEIPTCLVLWTSSACGAGCDPGEIWFFGATNANFSHGQPTGGRRGACTTSLSLP